MSVLEKKALLLALLLLLALWRLCYPQTAEHLRVWAEETLFPRGRQTVEAWGRSLSEEETIAALGKGAAP